MKTPALKNEESLFHFSEIFFSRTDKRGIIQACNSVFARVSAYRTEEILGQPHNLVRHPDMPKVVYRLFWDTLKSDQPIIAYVKNLSSNGKYYWVLAAAFPTHDGYVSIRIKPGTPLFHKIIEIYAQVRKEENSGEKSPDPTDLLNKIKALGFSSYQAMATRALLDEFENREKQISASHDKIHEGNEIKLTTQSISQNTSLMNSILTKAQKVCTSTTQSYNAIFKDLTLTTDLNSTLDQESQRIKNSYRSAKFLSVNMSIASEQIGDDGQTLTTISTTFEKWGQEANSALDQFIQSLTQATSRLQNASFYAAASRLQVTMMNSYVDEIRGNTEVLNLTDLSKSDLNTFSDMAVSAFESALQQTTDFLSSIRTLASPLSILQETMSALYIIRQNGKIEVSRLGNRGENFTQHLEELGEFIKSVTLSIETIRTTAYSIESSMEKIVNRLGSARSEFLELNRAQSR